MDSSLSIASTTIDVSKLPSKGKTYPPNAQISFRNYTYAEVKRISSSNLSEKESITLVLSGIQTNFDKLSITFSDYVYLGLFRKIVSLGTAKFRVPYNTPVNKKLEFHIMSSDQIEVEDLEVDVPAYLDLGEEELIFHPLTIGNVLKLIELDKFNGDNTYLMASMCVNKPLEDVYAKIATISDPDIIRDLNTIEDELNKGIKPITIECKELNPKTGKEVVNKVRIRLEGRGSLLLPFRDEAVPSRSRVSFGKRDEPKSDTHVPDGLL